MRNKVKDERKKNIKMLLMGASVSNETNNYFVPISPIIFFFFHSQ